MLLLQSPNKTLLSIYDEQSKWHHGDTRLNWQNSRKSHILLGQMRVILKQLSKFNKIIKHASVKLSLALKTLHKDHKLLKSFVTNLMLHKWLSMRCVSCCSNLINILMTWITIHRWQLFTIGDNTWFIQLTVSPQ